MGGTGTVAHLGSGTETTVLEVAREISHRLGGEVPVEYRPIRASDVTRSVSDISLARKLFGFEPRVSLAEGLDRTVAWFRESGA